MLCNLVLACHLSTTKHFLCVVQPMTWALDNHVSGLSHRGKSIEVIKETPGIHVNVLFFSSTQGKIFNWDTWDVAR